ncbi:hypothetical protein BDY19DRAFT_993688 [Irpex rosettiformis]|uniref:Uncharacterized protein n=1 Tax=Irpex rosettiformis TaxID=378272 RepID=A0ACB8U3Q0_9APHY|nr:hypothetical protein BDY19DRAFT_993688 [Irpex rosettiformis]
MSDPELVARESPVERECSTVGKGKKKKSRSVKTDGLGATRRQAPSDISRQMLTSFSTPLLGKDGLVKVALRESLTGGSFINTKFYAFSRRRSAGVVDEPLPIYANSELLRIGSGYFGGYFDAGFSEAKPGSLRDGFPSDKASSTELYDYSSDSDLEDENGQEKEKEIHDTVADVPVKQPEAGANIDGSRLEPSDKDVEYYGHIIVIPDVAFRTLKALIFHTYTGDINFAPLKSQPVDARRNCGIVSLKQQAKTDIQSKLTANNIVHELCSSLTSMYDEIRAMQVEFACLPAQRPNVLAGIPSWINEMANGNLGHTAATLAALVNKLSEQPPPLPPSPVDPIVQLANINICSQCNYANLNTSQPIFRFCTYCNNYRNPKV